MNKKTLLFSLLFSVIAVFVVTIGVSSASAHGWFGWGNNLEPEKVVEMHNQMFANQAELLGISVDKLKDYWAQGTDLKEIIKELGINQKDLQAKMKEKQKEQMKQQLQILVDKDIITQEQSDNRLKAMEQRMTNDNFGHRNFGLGMGGRMGRGFMKGFGCRSQDGQ